jgi:hypothetical protein
MRTFVYKGTANPSLFALELILQLVLILFSDEYSGACVRYKYWL